MEELAALAQTPAATAILAAMVGVGLYGLWRSPGLIERHLLRPYWLRRQGQYHTLFTSGFVHADLSHLLFNAYTFWAFAFALERTIGSSAFVALYFFGLLVSDAGTWLRHRNDPEYRCLGASGAILVVLFASIAYHPKSSVLVMPLPVPVPAPLFALAYLAYSVWASRRQVGRVNHDAHLAGAFAGVAFVALTDAPTLARAVHSWLD
ncbi:MAG: rhomboid family intramembrane serine protease [Pseudomonadota bacterium]|nr:rhomboid family intramembrane serine protease [Pseudomonadota bacterium]